MAARHHAAYRRADFVVIGAVLVALVGASAPFGAKVYADYARPDFVSALEPSYPQPVVEQAAARLESERTCLTEAMYFEARGEGEYGQRAVAEVVLERTRSRYYPNSICGVVYDGAHRGPSCQFSFVCDGSLDRRINSVVWEQSHTLARRILAGVEQLRGDTDRAIAYHATVVEPYWAGGMLRTTQIGNHIFYRPLPVSLTSRATPMPRSGILLPTGEIQPLGVSDKVETDIQAGGTVRDGT